MSMENEQGGTWVVFLVVGLMLNTVGIALPGIGWLRFVLMALGLAFLLTAVVAAMRAARSGDDRTP